MQDMAAIRAALDLMHVPTRVRVVRASELPAGISKVLAIAAGDDEALAAAANATERSPEVLRQAAVFFVEQALLFHDADSYRVLGGTRATPSGELRRHLALLLRWLHPDANLQDRAALVARVTNAWEDLKTPERRKAYDDAHQPAAVSHRKTRARRRRSGASKAGDDYGETGGGFREMLRRLLLRRPVG